MLHEKRADSPHSNVRCAVKDDAPGNTAFGDATALTDSRSDYKVNDREIHSALELRRYDRQV